MEVYRQKELYRSELLKQIFNLDVSGVSNVLQMTNPYGNFEFTYGLRMFHDLLGAESRLQSCEMHKFTIEDVIQYLSSYPGVWCQLMNKCDALGEIAILLWNAGAEFQSAHTVSLMAGVDIPLAGIQRLETLLNIPNALKAWADNWFPNEPDLESIMKISSVQSDLDQFLEYVVRGRFTLGYDNGFREGILPWSAVFQQIAVAHDIDGSAAFDLYNRLRSQKGLTDNITLEDFIYERSRNKRRRMN